MSMTRAFLTLLLTATAALPALAAAPDGAAAEPDRYYPFLSREAVGADAFTRAHPTWDGRGVVVAILDTGVDPSVPGLRETSDGQRKLIEARDFTGQGDVKLSKARETVEGGTKVLRTDDGFVKGHDVLGKAPADGTYWLGFFSEEGLKNSEVNDVNLDGHTDGRFAVLAIRPKDGEPVAVIDTDGDGDLADEKLRESYRLQPEYFAFANPDPRKNQTPVAFTLTVLLEPGKERVELHFDDGGHGTHCAGISTGYRIQGREGFDGIAPGARLISLKIGDNSLAGGATTEGSMKRAIEYASQWARDHRVPVVINLSYGVGSEIEGMADIDQVLTEALEGNPLLVASVAGGNEGPGISTIGTPGASARAWTAGALLTVANARDLFGGGVTGDSVFSFSGRGGELAKPDGIAPGVAWSTVPPWLDRSVMGGTSMATPESTGVHALLISAALADDKPWSSATLKRALKATARPLPGYTVLDQGAGIIQVGPAWQALLRLGARKPLGAGFLDWDVSTPVPQRPGDEASGSLWRVGTRVPTSPDGIDVQIAPAFFSDTDDAAKREFFADLALRSDSPWLRVDRGRVAVRGSAPGKVRLFVDAGRLNKPGLYVGRVIVTPVGDPYPAFYVPVSFVVPYGFTTPETRTRRFEGRLGVGQIERYYVRVPPAATSMSIDLSTPEGRFGQTSLYLFDPAGRPIERPSFVANSETGRVSSGVIAGADLKPGIWELIPYGSFRNRKESSYRLEVGFSGITYDHDVTYEVADDGKAEARLTLTNRFDDLFRGTVSATVVGARRTRSIDIEGNTRRVPLTITAGESGLELSLSVTAETYNRFTDIAVNVLDAKGKAAAQTGFNGRFAFVELSAPPGSYELELVGGRTNPSDASWTVVLEELHLLKSPLSMSVELPGDASSLVLYPDVPVDIELKAPGPLTELPDELEHALRLRLVRREETRRPWLDVTLPMIR